MSEQTTPQPESEGPQVNPLPWMEEHTYEIADHVMRRLIMCELIDRGIVTQEQTIIEVDYVGYNTKRFTVTVGPAVKPITD